MKVFIARENNAIEIALDVFDSISLSKFNLGIEPKEELNAFITEIMNDKRIRNVYNLTENDCPFSAKNVKETLFSEIEVGVISLQEDGSILDNHPGCSFEALYTNGGLGIRKILQVKRLIVFALGAALEKTVRELLTGEKTEDFPASALFDMENCVLILDEQSSKLI